MKRPLVHALAFFASGILAGFFLVELWAVAAFFALVTVVSLCLFVIYRWLGVGFMPIFAFVGFIAISLNIAPPDANIEELALRNQEAVFAGRITQLTTTRAGNQRATIVLESFRFGDEAIESNATFTAIISDRSFARYDFYDQGYNYALYLHHENPPVQNGQFIVFSGTPQQLSRARNPGAFDAFIFYRSRGIDYSINPQILYTGDVRTTPLVLLDNFRERMGEIYDMALPEREAGIARSIILGDRSTLEVEVTDIFRRAGIAHILTISGLHISIVALTLERLFKLVLSQKKANVATLVLVGIYVAFTGFGLPAVRAFIMYSMLTLGRLLNRDRDLLTSISLAAFLILLYRPIQLFDIGFQFSFSAVYAIAIGSAPFERIMERLSRRWPVFNHPVLHNNIVRGSIMTTLTITLFTLPLVTNTFYHFYIYSILTNTLIVPTLGVATVSGFIIGLVGLVSPNAAMFVSGIFYAVMQVYIVSSELSIALPGSEILVGHVPYIIWAVWWLLLILASAYIVGDVRVSRRLISTTAAITAALFVGWLAMPHGFSITFVDVGQGDATIIRNNRRTYIVDGGGSFLQPIGESAGIRTLIPYLQHQGIRRIDGAFVTHFHYDHAAGIIELVDAGLVRQVFISDTAHYPHPLYIMLRDSAAQHNTEIVRIAMDSTIHNGNLTITCIHPPRDYYARDINDLSLVLNVTYNNASFLLTGDLTRAAELDILSRGHNISTNILSLGHHGSATSSSLPFLHASDADLAIISAGRNNMFNHPSYRTLFHLAETNLTYISTAYHGAITITPRNNRLIIRTMF